MAPRAEAQQTAFRTPRSWTVVHFLPGDFKEFRAQNLAAADFPAGVFRVEDSSRAAALTSTELAAAFPFDELLLSADAVFPGGGELLAEAQVRTEAGWSPWFSFGLFNSGGGSASAGPQDNAFGKMDIDTLKLKTPAAAFRYRLTFPPSGGAPAVLRLAAAAYTASGAAYSQKEAVEKPAGFKPVRLAMPRYSQMIQQVNYAGDICSPVSLTMACAALGLKGDPLATAAAVRDAAADIYGNWFFNTAHAGARGFYSFLARLNSLEDARAFLAAGIPVIASVTFGPDELRNSPLKKTKGHLVAITGFDSGGNVLVNDPAAPDESTVARVYDRGQFAAAWLKNKYGTAYLLAKDLNAFLSVKTGVAELYSMPPAAPGERAKLIESQLLFNEKAGLIETSGPWARVKASEQRSLRADKKELAPYEGWLELDSLAFSMPLTPTAVVKSKTAGQELSMGVKLRLIGPAGGASARALSGNGRALTLPLKDLTALREKTAPGELRKKILEAARVFLGDKYYWGGRSAWGIDCSGLVNLAYRAWGLDLPRNAGDQFAAAKSVALADLKPADLIFSSDLSRPGFINHVMLYAGAGKLIEATGDTNSVREVSFAEKFGADFKKAKNGMTAGGKKIFFRKIMD